MNDRLRGQRKGIAAFFSNADLSDFFGGVLKRCKDQPSHLTIGVKLELGRQYKYCFYECTAFFSEWF